MQLTRLIAGCFVGSAVLGAPVYGADAVEIEHLRDQVLKYLEKAKAGNVFSAPWYAGKATGVAVREVAWFTIYKRRNGRVAAGGPFEDILTCDEPVNLPFIGPVLGSNSEIGSLFGLGSVSATVEEAVNDAMEKDAAVTHLVASFMLAYARCLGCTTLNDLESANARLEQMKAFKVAAVPAAKTAAASWSALLSVLLVEALDETYLEQDTMDFQAELAADGRAAFPAGFEDSLIDIGYTVDRIDGELIPNLLAVVPDTTVLTDMIALDIAGNNDMESALNELLADKIPAVSHWGLAVMTLLVFVAGTLVFRRSTAT